MKADSSDPVLTAARTRYGTFRASGYYIGSSVVEAGCRTVVGRRLKASGMFWSHRGGMTC